MIQPACARFCFNIPPRMHVTPYANIFKMEMRRVLHLAIVLFGIMKFKITSYLGAKLVWARYVKTAFTGASAWSLVLPRHRTTAFRGSLKSPQRKYRTSCCPRHVVVWNQCTHLTANTGYIFYIIKKVQFIVVVHLPHWFRRIVLG